MTTAVEAAGLADLDASTREALRVRALNDFYFFCKAVLRYDDMTPDCHGRLCEFITNLEWRRKMTLQPRGHLKTSIVTIAHSLWVATKDPATSILIINESEENAIEFLAKIKEFVKENALYNALFPEVIPDWGDRNHRWSAKFSDLRRPEGSFYVGPTWGAMGIKGSPTSRHVRKIVFDDMFGEEAAYSEAVAERCWSVYAKSDSLLVDPGLDTIDIVGTHWLPHDIYVRIADEEGAVFLNSEASGVEAITDEQPTWMVWKRQCYYPSGDPIWPERFTEPVLQSIKRKQGTFFFALQYLNDPIAPENVDFFEGDIRYWRRAPDQSIALPRDGAEGGIDTFTYDDLDIIMILDPAAGLKDNHSRTAIMVLAMTPLGQVVVLDTWAKRCKKTSRDPSRPGWLDKLFQYQRIYHPRACYFEAVAFQKIIGAEIEDRNWEEEESINVQEIKLGGPSQKSKPVRIRSTVQPILESHRLFLATYQTILKDELIKHPMGKTTDLLDCLAHGATRLIMPETAEEARLLRKRNEDGWKELGVTGYGDDERILPLDGGVIH